MASVNLCRAADILPETEEAFQQRMQWFTDAQFGLFIHYGVYSTLGGEWKGKPIKRYAEWIQRWASITPEEYIPLAADFRPDKLDADLWVKTAKEAGMKYSVDLPTQTWGKLAQAKGSTKKTGELFAYVFDRPADGKQQIKGFNAEQVKAFT